MRAALIALAGCALLAGCYRSHEAGGGDDDFRDAGTVDARYWNDAGCPWVGIYAGCDDLCGGSRECPPGFVGCLPDTDICIPESRWMDERQPGCDHIFRDGGRSGANGRACIDVDSACAENQREGVDRRIEDRDGNYSTGCAHISLCLAPAELHPTLGCYYSDLTRVETGPPTSPAPRTRRRSFPSAARPAEAARGTTRCMEGTAAASA